MSSIKFNGKFLSANPTGVHRVAEELITALHKLMEKDDQLAARIEPEILMPRSANRTLDQTNFAHKTVGSLTWQLWEQIDLPRHTRNQLLVNLCNLAPIRHRTSISMIHDAQVFISPESYSRPFRMWYQFALPQMGRANLKILTVSDYSKTQLQRWNIAPSDKIEVIHNGVDHIRSTVADDSVLSRLGLSPDSFSLGLSNTQAHKNLRVAIEAHQNPALANRKLVLFGGAKKQDFEALGLHIPDNIVFAGYVEDSELKSLMTHANAMLFPSLTEGFGLPPLEAMALGTPAICAPCGALPEVCGDSTLYVDPHDPHAWAQAICDMADETAAVRTSRIHAAKDQASLFTWDRAARKLADVIIEQQSASSG